MQLRRTLWRLAEVIEVVPETPRTKDLLLEVPEWEGHKAGQHVDGASLRTAARQSRSAGMICRITPPRWTRREHADGGTR